MARRPQIQGYFSSDASKRVAVAQRQRERSLCESETANSPYRRGSPAPPLFFDTETAAQKPPAAHLRNPRWETQGILQAGCPPATLLLGPPAGAPEIHAVLYGGATRAAEQLPHSLLPPATPRVRAASNGGSEMPIEIGATRRQTSWGKKHKACYGPNLLKHSHHLGKCQA